MKKRVNVKNMLSERKLDTKLYTMHEILEQWN
jgi:hypothetical protein